MKITTPSKYEVHFKEYLTFGQKRVLQRLIFSQIRVTPSTDAKKSANVNDFSVEFMQDVQDKACEMLIEKIIINGKEHTDNLVDLVLSWRDEDGQAVYTKVDELTALFVEQGKKK